MENVALIYRINDTEKLLQINNISLPISVSFYGIEVHLSHFNTRAQCLFSVCVMEELSVMFSQI